MVNRKFLAMLENKSVIRELSEYATARGKEIGYENVFDFSLGNPSVPAPDSYRDVCIRLLQEEEPLKLHGYNPTQGDPRVKERVAQSLSRRFGLPYTPGLIFPTSGAAGAVAHALRCVVEPGEEVIVFAPYFSEYDQYIDGAGGVIRVVPARTEDFQINFEAAESFFNEKTAAVLINTPNNPSGAVYTEETLGRLAELMEEESRRFGHTIFLVSDEPYREIVFDGKVQAYPAKFYPHTLTCYSFSKSLSLPGERIGYVAVAPDCEQADKMVPMMGQISRGTGHNCPSALPMLAAAYCLEETSDLSVYEKNMNLLYDAFKELGFTVPRPGGTFYIMPKALEDDAVAFCKKALDYDLVFVPGDGFHAPGFFRAAYCVATEKVERSLAALRRFVEAEYPDAGKA